MNYRHVFHAGNFADVVKHTILTRILTYLMRKDAPFRVIDTHAGVGLYDLKGPAAEKTGEWVEGIGRLMEEELAEPAKTLLTPYRGRLCVVSLTQRRKATTLHDRSPYQPHCYRDAAA